jgi:hypothetical protein
MDYAGVDHQTIADMMGHRDVTTFGVTYRHNLRPVVKGTRSALAGIAWRARLLSPVGGTGFEPVTCRL